jgi:Zn-dependent metalloprotease
MKKLIAFALLTAVLTLPPPAFAKTGDRVAYYEIPETRVTKVDGWVVRAEEATGMARLVMADGSPRLFKMQAALQPQEIARDYVQRHEKLLFGEADAPEFEIDEIIESKSGHHIHMRQTVGGVPVFDSYLSVHTSREGQVLLVNNGSRPRARIDRVDPVIRVEDAIKLARSHKGVKGQLRGDIEEELVVYEHDGDFRLSWMVIIPANEPLGDWLIIVDAADGGILHERDILMYVDGTGMVFDPNPVATTGNYDLRDGDSTDVYRTQRSLLDLDGSGYLQGPFAGANNSVGGRAYETGFVYNYTSMILGGGGHFEEVMYYYHVDNFQRYIQSLGIMNANNRMTIADVHGTAYDNSWYSQSTKKITYGFGGVNDAADAEIILHEYGHAIHDNIVPGFGGYAAGALSEGFADFCGTGFFEDPWVGEWDATSYNPGTPSYLRRLNTGMIYPDSLEGQIHWDGQIFSGACYDFMQLVGKDLTFELVIEGLFYTGPSSGMPDAADGVAAADLAIYGGAHVPQIRTAFGGRGLGTAYDLSIFHTPITDTEDTTGPYQVITEISHTDPLILDSLLVHYRLDGGAFASLRLMPTGETDEFSAEIPGQPPRTTVDYYISVMDSTESKVFEPEGAPGIQHTFSVGSDTLGPVIVHTPLGDQFLGGWPAVVAATITDNLGVDDSSVQVMYRLNGIDQTPFSLTRTYADQFVGTFNASVSVGDSVSYRIVAADTSLSENITYHPESGYHSFLVLQELGRVLVIDDDTGDRPASGQFPPGKCCSIEIMPMTLPGDEVTGASALRIRRALEQAGYDVVCEASSSTSPTAWYDYDFIVSSSGADIDPVSSAQYRSALEQYVTSGGRLLIEGGEVGFVSVYDYPQYPGPYPSFAAQVLHTDHWMTDNSGALVVVTAYDDHPVLTSPNVMPGMIPVTFNTYGDQDAQRPLTDAYMICSTTSHPNHAGIIVYEDTGGSDAKVVYYALNCMAISDTATTGQLIENTASFLMSDEKITALRFSGRPDHVESEAPRFELLNCSPNPFNPTTTISYRVPAAGEVAVEIFNVRGALVRRLDQGRVDPGVHSVVFNGRNEQGRTLGSGLYFFRVRYENDQKTGKVLLLK